MTPRPTKRDRRFITAEITTRSEGGTFDLTRSDLLAGGVILLGGPFVATVADDALPYDVVMDVSAQGGRLVCDRLEVLRRPDGPAVTGSALRSLVVETYLQVALARHPHLALRTDNGGKGGLSRAERVRAADAQAGAQGGARKQGGVALDRVVQTYREVLDDPMCRARPTSALGERLGVTRGHASKLLTRARDEGLLLEHEIGRGGRPHTERGGRS